LLDESECIRSSLVDSRQGILFNVDKVLRGQVVAGRDVTAYYSLAGNDQIEIVADGCVQLSPEIFSIGSKFIVACKLGKSPYARSGWSITGGPWIADSESERGIANMIAQGSISYAEEVWLLHEVTVGRFIEDQQAIPNSIRQGIKFFEGVTGIRSSESGKKPKDISKAALRENLESWKKWYECHHDTLSWDDKTYNVVANKDKLRKEEPCSSTP
jgi:hypothetical protein